MTADHRAAITAALAERDRRRRNPLRPHARRQADRALTREIGSLIAELEHSRDALMAGSAVIKRLRMDLQEARTQRDQAVAAHKAAEDELAETKRERDAELERRDDLTGELRKRIDAHVASNDSLRADCRLALYQRDEATAARKAAEDELAGTRRTLGEDYKLKCEQYDEASAECHRLRGDVDRLTAQLAARDDEVHRLRSTWTPPEDTTPAEPAAPSATPAPPSRPRTTTGSGKGRRAAGRTQPRTRKPETT